VLTVPVVRSFFALVLLPPQLWVVAVVIVVPAAVLLMLVQRHLQQGSGDKLVTRLPAAIGPNDRLVRAEGSEVQSDV